MRSCCWSWLSSSTRSWVPGCRSRGRTVATTWCGSSGNCTSRSKASSASRWKSRRRSLSCSRSTARSSTLQGPAGSSWISRWHSPGDGVPGGATPVSVGAITYPLLKRAGYDRESAGGLLSAGGIGAVISPPILGAAAFIIAEILQISYLPGLKMAIIPTVLYYLAIFVMIELDARRFHLRQVQIVTKNPLRLVLRYWYLLSSFVVIPLFMIRGVNAINAVLWATIIALATSFLRRARPRP